MGRAGIDQFAVTPAQAGVQPQKRREWLDAGLRRHGGVARMARTMNRDPGPDAMPALLCLSTCPDAETAARIARTLIEERLAACVNRVPGVSSTYRWQGEVHDDAEVLLLIKTTRERLDALRERPVELHPYEVPELIALEIADGLPAYLDWLRIETSP
jgi:periplasmic divalent cation tolerance protein